MNFIWWAARRPLSSFERVAGALFEDFERRGGILRVVIGRVGDSGAQQLIVRARILKLFQDELLELLEFGVAVSGSSRLP